MYDIINDATNKPMESVLAVKKELTTLSRMHCI